MKLQAFWPSNPTGLQSQTLHPSKKDSRSIAWEIRHGRLAYRMISRAMPIGPDGPTSPSVMTAAMTSKAMTSKAVTSKAVVEMMAAAETERYAGPISVVAGTIAVRVVGIVTIAVVAANISPDR